MVLSSCLKQCESSPGLCDECSMALGGCRPLDQADQLRLIILDYKPACRLPVNYTHHRHLLLLSPKADADFTTPQRVEGWVDLNDWLHTEMVYAPADGHPSKY